MNQEYYYSMIKYIFKGANLMTIFLVRAEMIEDHGITPNTICWLGIETGNISMGWTSETNAFRFLSHEAAIACYEKYRYPNGIYQAKPETVTIIEREIGHTDLTHSIIPITSTESSASE